MIKEEIKELEKLEKRVKVLKKKIAENRFPVCTVCGVNDNDNDTYKDYVYNNMKINIETYIHKDHIRVIYIYNGIYIGNMAFIMSNNITSFIKFVNNNYQINMVHDQCDHERKWKKLSYMYCDDHGIDKDDEECSVWNESDNECVWQINHLDNELSIWEIFETELWISCTYEGCMIDNLNFMATVQMYNDYMRTFPIPYYINENTHSKSVTS